MWGGKGEQSRPGGGEAGGVLGGAASCRVEEECAQPLQGGRREQFMPLTSALSQVGITTPGVQVYEVPQGGRGRSAGRTQDLATLQSKAQVAMGAVGGSDGRWPVPPAPPPTWTRGGHSWVYDHTYGVGIRPTTGIWGPGVLPKGPKQEEEEEVVEEVTEPDGKKEDIVVPESEVVRQEEQAAPAPAPYAEQAPDFVAPDFVAPAPAQAPPPPSAPVIEEVVTPSGKKEEVVVVPPPAPAAVAPASAPAPAPVVEEVVTPSGKTEEVVVAPPPPPAASQSVVYVQSAPPPQQFAVPVPAPASNQLPMEWAAEDAAEHAYNLAQWRVKILKAKNDQALLRKKLMEISMGETPGSVGTKLSTGEGGSGSSGSSGGRGREANNAQLVDIKKNMLMLASQTVDAIKVRRRTCWGMHAGCSEHLCDREMVCCVRLMLQCLSKGRRDVRGRSAHAFLAGRRGSRSRWSSCEKRSAAGASLQRARLRSSCQRAAAARARRPWCLGSRSAWTSSSTPCWSRYRH